MLLPYNLFHFLFALSDQFMAAVFYVTCDSDIR
jgi:hypothetical protein